jgi:hypothetical protein
MKKKKKKDLKKVVVCTCKISFGLWAKSQNSIHQTLEKFHLAQLITCHLTFFIHSHNYHQQQKSLSTYLLTKNSYLPTYLVVVIVLQFTMYLPTLTEPTAILCESMSTECRLNYFLLFFTFYPLPPPPPKTTQLEELSAKGIYGVSGKLGLGFQALVSLSASICRLLTNILSQGLQQEEDEEEDDDDEERRKRERVMRIF